MGKLAYVFLGHGSKYVGIGYDFYKEFPKPMDVFHYAETALKCSLRDTITV